MLGKFTSDPIEKEFGKLRQGSAGTYFITVQQMFEKVAITKTNFLLCLDADNDFPNLETGHSCSKCGFLLSEDMCTILDNLPELESSLSVDTITTLVYIAGYVVVRNDDDVDDTYFCFEKYGSFTNEMNRGIKFYMLSVCPLEF